MGLFLNWLLFDNSAKPEPDGTVGMRNRERLHSFGNG